MKQNNMEPELRLVLAS